MAQIGAQIDMQYGLDSKPHRIAVYINLSYSLHIVGIC